jgi:thioesterase domain-containing protein/acyl carrier protein
MRHVALPATPPVTANTPRPAASPSSERHPGPADAVAQTIASLWEDLLGVQGIGLHDDFFALGGHSLIAVRLVARLEKIFNVKLRLATLFEARTVQQLADLVRQGQQTPTWLSLVPVQAQGSRPPFYCVHGVGGEVLGFSELARLLAPDQPFYAFRSAGHDGTHEPLTQIEAQAALYIKEMRALQPAGPYYLGGFSHGGRVAFEMAQQLIAMGQEVGFVGVLDTYPCRLQPGDFRCLLHGLRNLPRVLQHGVWRIALEDNLRRLQRGSKKVTGTLRSLLAPTSAPPVQASMVQYLHITHHPESIQRTIIANLQAFNTYVPTTYPGRVTLFRASSQPLFGPHQPDLGWGMFAAGGVEVHEIPGAHDTILNQPHVQVLARELRASLAAAQGV